MYRLERSLDPSRPAPGETSGRHNGDAAAAPPAPLAGPEAWRASCLRVDLTAEARAQPCLIREIISFPLWAEAGDRGGAGVAPYDPHDGGSRATVGPALFASMGLRQTSRVTRRGLEWRIWTRPGTATMLSDAPPPTGSALRPGLPVAVAVRMAEVRGARTGELLHPGTSVVEAWIEAPPGGSGRAIAAAALLALRTSLGEAVPLAAPPRRLLFAPRTHRD